MAKEKIDARDRQILLTRVLDAPIDLVWEVWTDPAHIAKWWGPNGFTNTISKMEVAPGGEWEFVMHGPDGTDYKNKNVFKEIIKHRKIVYEHVSAPRFTATVEFDQQGEQTGIRWHMLFESREQFIQVVKTFKADEGLRQNIEKLYRYTEAQLTLRKQLKTNTMARTCTYLNFPGNTEEAFNFYKQIFRTEFIGGDIRRFGDLPPSAGHPPLSDADKKMVLHIELPITGEHILMATDSPISMGFTLVQGNNMHINLEPESREETKRIFDALAGGGKVTMPLQDMFWGAYYGSCTDKYGINWMVNYSDGQSMW